MKKLIIIGLAALLVLGGGGAAAYIFVLAPKGNAKTAKVAEKPKPLLFAEMPDLVASIPPDAGEPASSYLQMSIQFSTTDPNAETAFDSIEPIIKAQLIDLMLGQTGKTVIDPAARQALLAASLKVVNQALKKNIGYTPGDPFTAAYITSLVIQN